MHHANLLIGSVSWALSRIPAEDRIPGIDVSHRTFDRMGIDDVRRLSYDASLRPLERSHRTFVLFAETILGEAQNALLKLFEEPNATTVFYLVLTNESMLLPTLRSRLHLLDTESFSYSGSAFESFREKTYGERLEIVAEKLKAEDDAWIAELLLGVELHAHTSRNSSLMEDVLMVESYIRAPGSSKKMLLEHLALSL